jgi:hypothetical protein
MPNLFQKIKQNFSDSSSSLNLNHRQSQSQSNSSIQTQAAVEEKKSAKHSNNSVSKAAGKNVTNNAAVLSNSTKVTKDEPVSFNTNQQHSSSSNINSSSLFSIGLQTKNQSLNLNDAINDSKKTKSSSTNAKNSHSTNNDEKENKNKNPVNTTDSKLSHSSNMPSKKSSSSVLSMIIDSSMLNDTNNANNANNNQPKTGPGLQTSNGTFFLMLLYHIRSQNRILF